MISHVAAFPASPLFLSLVLSAPLALLAACGDADDECVCPASRTQIIGHRGSGDSAEENPLPENTVPSSLQALADGADGVEIDVQLSSDGVLVLMHDAQVDRTTDGSGCTGELTLAELTALDAGNPASLGEGIRVPAFADLLAELDEGLLDVELKVVEGHATCPDTDRAATVAALLDDLAGFPRERLIVSSFDAEILRILRAEDPSVAIAALGHLAAPTLELAETEGFEAVAILYIEATDAVVADAHARGLEVWVWTLNDPTAAETLMHAEVDGIITNDVPAIFTLREAMCEGFAC